MNKTEKFWNRLSKNYDKPDEINKVSEYTSIEYIKKYLKNSDIVLDLGCATGTIASSIADRVKEMHGIDISYKMIQIAKERAIERKIENIVFSKSTIFDKKYMRYSFNVILAFSILHLLEDIEKVMKRINEILKPGGYFFSLTPCLGEKKLLGVLSCLGYKIGILPYVRSFRIDELEKLIADSNFHIVESKCLDNNPLEFFIIAKKL
jgi:2-polyprenyl-3-methyl-5-hydroxy-6-metoxy-1,4-benzoquinol methylase